MYKLVPKHLFLATIIDFLFSLTAFNCDQLGPPTNGQLRLSNSTTVNYTCDTGYRLRGASTRRCTAIGKWTGSVPQCIRKLRATTIHLIDSVYRLIYSQMDERTLIETVSIIHKHRHPKWCWHVTSTSPRVYALKHPTADII